MDGRVRKAVVTVVAILLALLVARVAMNAVLPMIGLAGDPLFFSPADRFADSIKTALAETAVTGPLWHDPRVASWPPLIRKYLFYNEYLQPGATIHHLPPVSTLLMMGFAALFFWLPPTAVIGLLLSAYAAGSLGVARAVERLSRATILLPAFLLIFLSYPALFMMDRGNLHSGFTSLLVLLYVFTAFYGRGRWLGWLALALAANIRPNVALFALLELGRDRTWRDMATAYAAMGAMGLAAGLGSLWLAGRIDPAYSLPEFLRSYAWYQKDYVEGWRGMGWNLSLPNVAKLAWLQAGRGTLYDPLAATATTAFGAALTLVLTGLHAWRKVPVAHFVFALTVACSIFTPVFGEYHAVVFVAPLLLFLLNHADTITPRALWRGAGLLLALQLTCLASTLAPLAIPLAAFALAFPLLASRLFGAGEGRSDYVMALASMAALAPLGGETSNGLAIALLLVSTLTWLAWQSLLAASRRDSEAEPRWT